MQKVRSFWSEWANFLHRFGLTELAAAMLEAAGPLNIFMAQILYAGQTFAGGGSAQRLEALGAMFENPEERESFAAFLREESPR